MRVSLPAPLRSIVASAGALLAAATLGASPAHAGGLGIMATMGGHNDRVDSYNYDEESAAYTQFTEYQMNPNMGTGLELVLGDKDNKILGIFRAYYLQDSPIKAPSQGDIYAVRETARPIGVINAGLQWGIIGNPDQLQFVAVTTLGSGFMTTDQTEFIVGEAGVGGTYMIARQLQLAANVTGGARYRKLFYPTVNGYVGVRYLFD